VNAALNTRGAYLFFGVDTEDGTAEGVILSQREKEMIKSRWGNLLHGYKPPILEHLVTVHFCPVIFPERISGIELPQTGNKKNKTLDPFGNTYVVVAHVRPSPTLCFTFGTKGWKMTATGGLQKIKADQVGESSDGGSEEYHDGDGTDRPKPRRRKKKPSVSKHALQASPGQPGELLSPKPERQHSSSDVSHHQPIRSPSGNEFSPKPERQHHSSDVSHHQSIRSSGNEFSPKPERQHSSSDASHHQPIRSSSGNDLSSPPTKKVTTSNQIEATSPIPKKSVKIDAHRKPVHQEKHQIQAESPTIEVQIAQPSHAQQKELAKPALSGVEQDSERHPRQLVAKSEKRGTSLGGRPSRSPSQEGDSSVPEAGGNPKNQTKSRSPSPSPPSPRRLLPNLMMVEVLLRDLKQNLTFENQQKLQ